MYKPSVTKTMTTLSKLHLGLLQSLDFCQSSSLSHCLLSVTDAMCLVKQLSTLLDRVRESQSDSGVKVEEDEVTHITLERLAQVLQVAKMAGCLRAQLGKCYYSTLFIVASNKLAILMHLF